MNISREALAQLSARPIREHHVLHVSADLLGGDDAVARARTEILRWARKRNGGELPPGAMEGAAFEHLSAGRNSSAVTVELPEITAWALRQEDPDKDVPGRIWTSEVTIWRTPDRSPRFAARLMVNSRETALAIAPAAPGYVRQLAENVGLLSDGRPVESAPRYITDEAAQDALINALVDPARRLPMLVVSAGDRERPEITLDLRNLAAGLCGLAEVVAILPDTSWALTEQFGKKLSVFDRAARLYMPGFDDAADPFAHPLWLGARMTSPEDAAVVDHQIRARAAAFSTRAVRLGTDMLPFAQLRSASRQAEQERLTERGASDADRLAAAEGRIAALLKELSEAKEMEAAALSETENALQRAEGAEAREHNATVRVQGLLQQLAERGGQREQVPLPTGWEAFEDWSDAELAGCVVLTGAARRGCRKALYADVAQAARCLLWLADTCRGRFLNGGGALRDAAVDDGLRNAACGSDAFTFDWEGQRLTADWHIKTGGNTRDPANCLRIYYAWDDRTQRIIVADMPAHRASGAS